jgi:hypothetical protein
VIYFHSKINVIQCNRLYNLKIFLVVMCGQFRQGYHTVNFFPVTSVCVVHVKSHLVPLTIPGLNLVPDCTCRVEWIHYTTPHTVHVESRPESLSSDVGES